MRNIKERDNVSQERERFIPSDTVETLHDCELHEEYWCNSFMKVSAVEPQIFTVCF